MIRPEMGRELMREREIDLLQQASHQRLIRLARGGHLAGTIVESRRSEQGSLLRWVWPKRYGAAVPFPS